MAELAPGLFGIVIGLFVLAVLAWLWLGPKSLPPASGRGGERRDWPEPAKRLDDQTGILFATYNIHGGEDARDKPSLERICADLGGADVVALQEVHDTRARSGQLRYLASQLDMQYLESPTRRAWLRNARSNALLSRLPLGRWLRLPLPHQHGRHQHFRNLTLCQVGDQQQLVVLFTHINTHKGSETPRGREDQLRAVLARFLEYSPAVLMGDLNTHSGDPLMVELLRQNPDVLDVMASVAPKDRSKRRDWILTRGLDVQEAGYLDSGASDHPMYWCRARFRPDSSAATATELPETVPTQWLETDPGSPWRPWSRAGMRSWLLLLALVGLGGGTMGPLSGLSGFFLILCGACLGFLARAHLGAGRQLTSSGPYAVVRHPQYLADLLVNGGLALMTGYWPLIALVPLWWGLVYLPAVRAEDARLQAQFSGEAQAYQKQVSAWLPRPRQFKAGWQTVFAVSPGWQREAGRFFRLLCYPLILLLGWRLLDQGAEILLAPHVVDGLLMSTVAGLVFSALVWNRHFLDGRPVLPADLAPISVRLLLFSLVLLAGLIHAMVELEFYSWLHWLPGLALLVVSLATVLRLKRTSYVAELLLVASIAMLLEVEWLVPLLAPLYLAIYLDAGGRRRRSLESWPRQLYAASLSLGLVVSLVLELELVVL